MDQQAMLGRIRKLLAMAEADGLTPEARESYSAKAAELIAQYGIDQALLDDARDQAVSAADVTINIEAPYARDKIHLLASVALPLRCTVVQIGTRSGSKQHRAHLFGMPVDLERVQLLYGSLVRQATLSLAATPVPIFDDPKAFRRSWLAGFSTRIHQRLKAAEAAAAHGADQHAPADSQPSTALVLARRDELVSNHLAASYPRVRTARPRRLSGTGGQAGWAAGGRASLGTGSDLTGTTSRRALR